jgi:predicted nuclease with TOPRIM domain
MEAAAMKLRSIAPRPIEKRLSKLPAVRAALDTYGSLIKQANARIEKVLTEEAQRLNAAVETVNNKLEAFVDEVAALDDGFEEVGDDLYLDAEPLRETIEGVELPDEELADVREAIDDVIDALQDAPDDEDD